MRRRLLSALLLGVVATGPALAADEASSLVDLHRVNWRHVLVPASACGTRQAVPAGQKVHSGRWPRYARISVDAGSRVVYGDLYGDGHDAAAMMIVCANLGGTAAGQLAFSVVVYRPGRHAPIPVGVLTPQVHEKPGAHVPVLDVGSIGRGKVTTTEAIYGPHDADCCASGLARTVWRLTGSRLSPAATVIVRAPKS